MILPKKENCQIKVLAPGFAEELLPVPVEPQATITRRIATSSQTVVLTATRTAVSGEESGADVNLPNGSQLVITRPTAAADAVRFLPGATIKLPASVEALRHFLFAVANPATTRSSWTASPSTNPAVLRLRHPPAGSGGPDGVRPWRAEHTLWLRRDDKRCPWARTGSTRMPDVRLGADGGNFSTAHGYASVAGARGPIDYNVFGSQFNPQGSGFNNAYSDSMEIGNVGAAINDRTLLRSARSPLEFLHWRPRARR